MALRRPELPSDLAAAVVARPGPRHPFLMQGAVFSHWPQTGPGHVPEKGKEAKQQAENLQNFFPINTELLQAVALRQRTAAARPGMHVRALKATATSAVLLGSGIPNQLEVGLLLHPLYGVPYLPGSALKGVTRSTLLEGWAAEAGIGPLPLAEYLPRLTAPRPPGAPPYPPTPLEAFERLLLASQASDDAWAEAWRALQAVLPSGGPAAATATAWRDEQHGRDKGQLFAQLFGWPPVEGHDPEGRRGAAIFFDAYPTVLKAEGSILTPHGGAYAEDSRALFAPGAGGAVAAPSDVYEPVPVPFVAIGEKTVFQIVVAARDTGLADVAAAAITRALTVTGIGAKGGSGYGLFRVVKA